MNSQRHRKPLSNFSNLSVATNSKKESVAAATPYMGKAGLEPARLAAHDPKSCSSANSDTSPVCLIITSGNALPNRIMLESKVHAGVPPLQQRSPAPH